MRWGEGDSDGRNRDRVNRDGHVVVGETQVIKPVTTRPVSLSHTLFTPPPPRHTHTRARTQTHTSDSLSPPPPTNQPESLSVLKEDVEEAVHSLKEGIKVPGWITFPLSCLWRRSNDIGPDNDVPDDLGDKEMVEEVDTIAHHTFTKERQCQAVLELSYHQPNQPIQQDHALSYSQLTQH